MEIQGDNSLIISNIESWESDKMSKDETSLLDKPSKPHWSWSMVKVGQNEEARKISRSLPRIVQSELQ